MDVANTVGYELHVRRQVGDLVLQLLDVLLLLQILRDNPKSFRTKQQRCGLLCVEIQSKFTDKWNDVTH